MNDKNTKVNVSVGGGFLGLLTLLFITLKLCGVIAWSWWWVLAPIWISWGFAIVLAVVALVLAVIIKKLK